MSLRERIDHFRQQADAEDRGQPVLEGDAVPEPQPEAPPSPAPTNGIDPEVAKALENPKIRAALEQEAMAHAGARQQYLSAVQQLGNVQTAALLSEFPELQSGNPRGTLELWRVSQPEKFAAVAGRLNQIQQVVNHWNGLQHQQQQQQAQQFGHFAKTADAEYDAFVKTRPPGEGKIVQQNLEGIFAHYGIDRGALTRLYNSSPEFRSVQFQRVMHDLALFHAARQASSQRGADPRVPKVFTPGDAASDRLTGQSAVVQQKMREFAQDPNPRTAAKALQARRRAASVLR
jgi:hypothetical protein